MRRKIRMKTPFLIEENAEINPIPCRIKGFLMWDKIGESKFIKDKCNGWCFDRGMLCIFKIGDLELPRFNPTIREKRDHF